MFSLVLQAIALSWSDQELLDLSVAWMNSQPDKQNRDGAWFVNNIANARAKTSNVIPPLGTSGSLPQEERIRNISTLLRVKVQRITRHDPPVMNGYLSPPSWTIYLEDGRKIPIPTIETLLTQRKFKILIGSLICNLLENQKGEKWDAFVEMFLNAAEVTQDSLESSVYYTTEQRIRDYVCRNTFVDTVAEMATGSHGQLYRDEDTQDIYFHWEGLDRYLRAGHGERYQSRELHHLLKAVGCIKRRWQNETGKDGQRIRTSLWRVPEGLL